LLQYDLVKFFNVDKTLIRRSLFMARYAHTYIWQTDNTFAQICTYRSNIR